MITVFNRKELFITFEFDKQSNIRNILSENNIDYVVKVINRTSPSSFSYGSRSRSGSFGINQSNVNEYIIYVHKRDFNNALHLINN